MLIEEEAILLIKSIHDKSAAKKKKYVKEL
jgi:hypothetical protein